MIGKRKLPVLIALIVSIVGGLLLLLTFKRKQKEQEIED